MPETGCGYLADAWRGHAADTSRTVADSPQADAVFSITYGADSGADTFTRTLSWTPADTFCGMRLTGVVSINYSADTFADTCGHLLRTLRGALYRAPCVRSVR